MKDHNTKGDEVFRVSEHPHHVVMICLMRSDQPSPYNQLDYCLEAFYLQIPLPYMFLSGFAKYRIVWSIDVWSMCVCVYMWFVLACVCFGSCVFGFGCCILTAGCGSSAGPSVPRDYRRPYLSAVQKYRPCLLTLCCQARLLYVLSLSLLSLPLYIILTFLLFDSFLTACFLASLNFLYSIPTMMVYICCMFTFQNMFSIFLLFPLSRLYCLSFALTRSVCRNHI